MKKEHINHRQHYLPNLQCKPQVIISDFTNAQETSQTSAKQITKIVVFTKHWSCKSSAHEVTHKSPTPNFSPLKQIY